MADKDKTKEPTETELIVTNEDTWNIGLESDGRYVELDSHILVPVFYYESIEAARNGDVVIEKTLPTTVVPCGYVSYYEVRKK